MTKARVLLVEDDASLQRFVALALELLDIELLSSASVDAALEILGGQEVELVLTDLMMPGRTGFDLIDALNARSQPAPRVVVYSAGLTPDVRLRLEAAGVWACLSKPCTVMQLENCVRDALAAPAARASDERPALQAARPSADDAAADAVMTSFGGNRQLHDAFRASCLLQFPADLHAGSRACRGSDMPALRMLAHNLKSVLQTLGHPEIAALAREIEQRAEAGDQAAATALWEALCARIRALPP